MSNCLNVVITTVRDLKLAIVQLAIDTINTSNARHALRIDADVKERLQVMCSIICSVNSKKQYLMWDTGEKLLWDNNIEIEL